jgi:hypothetical protein
MVLLAVLFTLFGYILQQQAPFPVDERGKYTFQEVTEIHGMDQKALFENGKSFLKKLKVLNSKKNYLSVDNDNFTITNKGSFYVYQHGSVNRAIDGAVEYDLTLEIKDGRYRYTITNFIFNEYKRNRYGKFEPINGKYMPLETEVSNLNKKGWENHRQVVYDKSQELIQNLYSNMIFSDEPDRKPKKIKKQDDW